MEEEAILTSKSTNNSLSTLITTDVASPAQVPMPPYKHGDVPEILCFPLSISMAKVYTDNDNNLRWETIMKNERIRTEATG